MRVISKKKKLWKKGEACISKPISKIHRLSKKGVYCQESFLCLRVQDDISLFLKRFNSQIEDLVNDEEYSNHWKTLYKISIYLDKTFPSLQDPKIFLQCLFDAIIDQKATDETSFCLLKFLKLMVSLLKACEENYTRMFAACILKFKKKPNNLLLILEIIRKYSPFFYINDQQYAQLLNTMANFVCHHNENVRVSIVKTFRILPICSDTFSGKDVQRFLIRILTNSKYFPFLNDCFAVIFSIGKFIESEYIFDYLIDQFLSSPLITQTFILKGLSEHASEMSDFHPHFNRLFKELMNVSLEECNEVYLSSWVKINSFVDFEKIENFTKFSHYPLMLCRLLSYPDDKLNFLCSKNISKISLFLEPQKFICEKKFEILLYEGCKILSENLREFANENDSSVTPRYRFTCEAIVNIIQGGLNRRLKFEPEIKSLLVDLEKLLSISNSQKFINVISSTLSNLVEYIGVDKVLEILSVEHECLKKQNGFFYFEKWLNILSGCKRGYTFSSFVYLLNIAKNHYTTIKKSKSNDECLIRIYRKIFNVLFNVFLDSFQESGLDEFQPFLRDVFENDQTVRSNFIQFFKSDGIKMISPCEVVEWVPLIFDYYLSSSEKNISTLKILESLQNILFYIPFENVDFFYEQIQENISIGDKVEKFQELAKCCLPCLSFQYMLSFLSEMLEKSQDVHVQKKRLNMLACWINSMLLRKSKDSEDKGMWLPSILAFLESFTTNLNSFHCSSILKCIMNLGIILTTGQLIEFLPFIFACLFSPTSKIIKRSRLIFVQIFDRLEDSEFSSFFPKIQVFLSDPILRYGSIECLHLLLVRTGRFPYDNSDWFINVLIECIDPSFSRLSKVALNILYLIRNRCSLFSKREQILAAIIKCSKFFKLFSIQKKIFSIINHLNSNCELNQSLSINYTEEFQDLKKRYKSNLKKHEKKISKSIEHEEDNPKSSDNESSITATHDKPFKTDDLGRIIVTEGDNFKFDIDDSSDSDEEVEKRFINPSQKSLKPKSSNSQKIIKKQKDSIQPFAYIPLERRDLKRGGNNRFLGRFKGVVKSKRRNK